MLLLFLLKVPCLHSLRALTLKIQNLGPYTKINAGADKHTLCEREQKQTEQTEDIAAISLGSPIQGSKERWENTGERQSSPFLEGGSFCEGMSVLQIKAHRTFQTGRRAWVCKSASWDLRGWKKAENNLRAPCVYAFVHKTNIWEVATVCRHCCRCSVGLKQ